MMRLYQVNKTGLTGVRFKLELDQDDVNELEPLQQETQCDRNSNSAICLQEFCTGTGDEQDMNHKGLDRSVECHWKESRGKFCATAPRRSLLGKPINYRRKHRDARYRRLQAKIYNFLERPKDCISTAYHIIVFLMVFICLLCSVFSTIDQYEQVASSLLYYLEMLMVIWFTIELIVRLWSAGCRSRYQSLTGRFHFARRPLCLVEFNVTDFVVILAGVTALCLGAGGQIFATSALRGLRFFQILRMVRIDRRGGSWKLLGSVIWAHRQELFTTLYIGFLGLIFSSFLMFLAEKEKNPSKFGTYADSLWWAVITLCTVGYGDAVPITWPGKLVAAFCALLGISFFALPAGILGSGFALKVQQQQRQKHQTRRKGPAAVLIQSVWRCYSADEYSVSVATWKPHLKAFKSTPRNNIQRFKNNASFISRLSSRCRESHPGPGGSLMAGLSSPSIPRRATSASRNHSYASSSVTDDRDLESFDTTRSHLSLNDFSGQNLFSSLLKRTTDSKDSEAEDFEDQDCGVTSLTEVHKRAIRALRKIKFFVARRKFKEALRPYDVKDVIEQYSEGNIDMLARIKNLQNKLDVILGKPGSKKPDTYDSKISLASRIVKVERQVDDIETKLDTLLEMYKEDREKEIQPQFLFCNVDPQQATPQSQEEVIKRFPCEPRESTGSSLKLNYSAINARCRNIRCQVNDLLKSEPNSPNLITSSIYHPTKRMRGQHSDLEPRIKKRVTIGGIASSSEGLFNVGSQTSCASESVDENSTNSEINERLLRPPIVCEEEEEMTSLD